MRMCVCVRLNIYFHYYLPPVPLRSHVKRTNFHILLIHFFFRFWRKAFADKGCRFNCAEFLIWHIQSACAYKIVNSAVYFYWMWTQARAVYAPHICVNIMSIRICVKQTIVVAAFFFSTLINAQCKLKWFRWSFYLYNIYIQKKLFRRAATPEARWKMVVKKTLNF